MKMYALLVWPSLYLKMGVLFKRSPLSTLTIVFLLGFACIYIPRGVSSTAVSIFDDTDNEISAQRLIGPDTKKVATYDWKIPNFQSYLDRKLNLVFSPKIYTGTPGYRIQMMLMPNSSYADNSSYVGLFFRLVVGKHDSEMNWPYRLKTVLSVADQQSEDYDPENENQDYSYVITPDRDPCRLRYNFLRPSFGGAALSSPDGCGNKRHISHSQLFGNERYLLNGTLLVRLTVYLNDYGRAFPVASLEMKHNVMTSEFQWSIKDFSNILQEASANESFILLKSDPFYTSTQGYLVQMFLSLLPKKKAFAISVGLVEGDFDRHLQWPFPYEFEIGIVDQSPGYWRRDFAISVKPWTSQCGSGAFSAPSGASSLCLVTIQSVELLSLKHYNFMRKNHMKLRFTTVFQSLGQREFASLAIKRRHLVAEFSWIIPAIEEKIDSAIQSSLTELSSNEFYTNSQGYLLQLVMSFNGSSDGHIGLGMLLKKGPYDNHLRWPFNNTFELTVVNQRPETGEKDLVIRVVPSSEEYKRKCPHAFARPGVSTRNLMCGEEQILSYDRFGASMGFVRQGNLLIKIRIYLQSIDE